MTDRWFGEDKAFHFCGSFTATMLLSLVFSLLLAPVQGSRESVLILAAVSAFIGGLSVELFQEVTAIDRFSWKDVVYNGAGCLTATALQLFNLV